MMNTLDSRAFQTRLERLDVLLREAQRADAATQGRLSELVQELLALHGAGLERLLEHVTAAGEPGRAILDACAEDGAVSGLLLLHGLHPLDTETRVRQALDGVRPYLQSHGGNVELLGIRNGSVWLRLHGSCHSCPSSALTMRQTIEEAIYGKAPEVMAIRLEGMAEEVLTAAEGQTRLALPLV